MARKADDARRQTEAKQKKLLLVLVPIFLLLVVWQGPGTVRAFTGGDEAAETVAQPPQATTAPVPTDPSAGPAPSLAAPADPAPAAEASLPETDVPVPPGEGQLVSFTRFLGKDPFKPQVVESPEAPDASSASAPVTPAAPPAEPPPPPAPATAATAAFGGRDGEDTGEQRSAQLDVNGATENLEPGDTFPAGDPVFRLAKVGARGVKIGLVTGSFTGGMKTVNLRVGKKLVLVSRPDGLHYRIALVAVA